MSDSVQPHRRQPTRLLCPWDSPGKNTGVGCHCLLQCMKVKSESEVAQSCPTLSDPMDWSLPGSSVHGIFQARVLKWGAIVFSKQRVGGRLSFGMCGNNHLYIHLRLTNVRDVPACGIYYLAKRGTGQSRRVVLQRFCELFVAT